MAALKVFRNETQHMNGNVTCKVNQDCFASFIDIPFIPQPKWSLSSLVALFAIIAGGIFNLTVLGIFIKRRSLRNSFGVYLMNLLVVDSILVLLHGPFNLVEKYYPSWTLGHKVCAFLNYMGYTYQNLIILAHFLIALNRVWAVVFPFSYRTHHTTKVAISLCTSAWLILNICNIPVAIVTTTITLGAINGTYTLLCDIDLERLGAWGPISQVLLFDIPILFVILAYPVVSYNSFFNNRKRKVTPHSGTQSQGNHNLSDMGPAKTSVHAGDSHGEHGEKGHPRKAMLCGRTIHGSKTGFVTLTLMTSSVILCLMPKEAYYTWLMVTNIDPPGVGATVDVLQRLTTVFDPMLVVLGNTELRKIVCDLLTFRKK